MHLMSIAVMAAGSRGRLSSFFVVAGCGAFDAAGTVAGQQRGQDCAADGAGLVSGVIGADSRGTMSWSRAAPRAGVKLARSGSVPGRAWMA